MAFIQNQIGRLPSYGAIYMNTGNFSGVSFAFTTSYQELTSIGTNFTLASPAQDFAMSTDGRLKYTGIPSKRFLVDAVLNTSSLPDWTALQLYKNGSGLSDSISYAISSVKIASFEVELATNDYLSLFTKTQNNGSYTISNISLAANSVNRV